MVSQDAKSKKVHSKSVITGSLAGVCTSLLLGGCASSLQAQPAPNPLESHQALVATTAPQNIDKAKDGLDPSVCTRPALQDVYQVAVSQQHVCVIATMPVTAKGGVQIAKSRDVRVKGDTGDAVVPLKLVKVGGWINCTSNMGARVIGDANYDIDGTAGYDDDQAQPDANADDGQNGGEHTDVATAVYQGCVDNDGLVTQDSKSLTLDGTAQWSFAQADEEAAQSETDAPTAVRQ
jgi:hypothetical protein